MKPSRGENVATFAGIVEAPSSYDSDFKLPLHPWLRELQSRLAASTVNVDQIASDLFHALPNFRKKLLAEFEAKYPDLDLKALWRSVMTQKPPLTGLPLDDQTIADFVNVTAWCYAKEGTREKGRFSISRLWRYVDRTDEQVRSFLRPFTHTIACAHCRKQASYQCFTAMPASLAWPAVVQCDHCGHYDISGRPNEISPHRPDERCFTAILKCQCSACSTTKAQVSAEAAARADHFIEESVHYISDYAAEKCDESVIHHFRSRNSYGDLREKGRLLLEEVDARIHSGESFEEALSACSSAYFGDGRPLANAVEVHATAAVSGCWAKRLSARPIQPESTRLAVARDCLDRIFFSYPHPRYSLANFRAEMVSGDIEKVLHACSCGRATYFHYLPIAVTLEWLGPPPPGQLPGEDDVLDYPGKAPAPMPPVRTNVRPEQWWNSLPLAPPRPRDPRVLHAAALASACMEQIDRQFGPGTALAHPELVAQYLRAALDGSS